MEGEDQTKGISGVIALQRPPSYSEFLHDHMYSCETRQLCYLAIVYIGRRTK